MLSRHQIKTRIRIIRKYRELMMLRKKLHLSEDNVRTLLSFMFELTSTGFEHYIGEYLQDYRKCDAVKVTGGYEDQGVDIKATKNGHLYALQCKKNGTSHVRQGDLLDFVHNTSELREKQGNKVSFFMITTSWVNSYARNIAKKYGIGIKDYKDMIKLDAQFPLLDFIKEHRLDPEMVEPLEVEELVDMFYLRKGIKPLWLADFIHLLIKKSAHWGVNYEYIDHTTKNDPSHDYEFLVKE